jgi:EAL domain-containing protein (putative c-di-GMP-specific phosphodiesterase class I)/GGDEF domain-containing protein
MPTLADSPKARGLTQKKLRPEAAPRTASAPTGSAFSPNDLPHDLLNPEAELDLDRKILAYGHRYDLQTGLLYYPAFEEALSKRMQGGPAGHPIAMIWIDLVNLRREFTLWGWAGAEALARRVAGQLRAAADPEALLGRIGSRSFLVALPAAKADKAARHRIQALLDSISSLRLRGFEMRSEAVAGMAFYPTDTSSFEDLVRFASLAATRAGYIKSQAVVPFQPAMNRLVIRDHILETEIRKGLDQNEFSLVYQPKVDLNSGKVLGAEALIRWHHPAWGTVGPKEFIPVAERSDLIQRIFELSLRTALSDAAHWRKLGLELPIIAVNASAANVRKSGFARFVRSVLAELPVAPTELELEMTESLAFEDEELFKARVRQLRTIGVRIAIDDFGTRYTGFNVLREVPLNAMKIDQCFISGIDRSREMRALCQTIVAMARQLGLRTVAEGIERRGELRVLREIGCEAGQGYLLKRPVPADEFTAFLRGWPKKMRAFGFAPPGKTRRTAADKPVRAQKSPGTKKK